MGYLPRHLQPFSSSLDYVSSVAKFALVAAPLGCAVSALIDVWSLHHFSDLPDDMVLQGLWVWWLGDLLGVLLIAPLLLTGASLAIFLAALIVMGVAVVSYGGINDATTPRDVFALQFSMITMALGGLFVSAALTERRYSEMRLDMLANHDPLTGLPNRSYFQDFLGHALARARREHSQVSLLFIDLDRFKHINDSQGTKWVIRSSASWPAGCTSSCAPMTLWHGWVGTSSPSS